MAYKDYFMVADKADQAKSDALEASITQYFESFSPLNDYEVNKLVSTAVTCSPCNLFNGQRSTTLINMFHV